MKNLRVTLILLISLSLNNVFGQEQKKDSINKSFETIINYSMLRNSNKYIDGGHEAGVQFLLGIKRKNGWITKIGTDIKVQVFGTPKTIDFNRDSLWSSNYTTPHLSGQFNNGITNFQFGIPISLGYQFQTNNKKNRLEVNLGATTFYTWSNLIETYSVSEKGSTYNKTKTTDLFFIQHPININATGNINYIINKYWVVGLNASYAINSFYKTNYMRFNPLMVGVSVGYNINNYSGQVKK